jgi:cation-transporting P-type ATPase C
MLKVKHSMPGRVRFFYSPIKGNYDLAVYISTILGKSSGIYGVRYNIKCASLVVQFDYDVLS